MPKTCERQESLLDSASTGFGSTNRLEFNCFGTPSYKIPLYKENYFSEFVSETEKQLVRNNLGIVGESEVLNMVKKIIKEDTGSFITKEDIKEMVQDLDFVDSTLSAKADYAIPDKLFKL